MGAVAGGPIVVGVIWTPSLGRTGMGSPASCVTIVNPQPAPMGSQLGSQGGQICERNGRDNRDLAAEARTPADRRGANRSAGDLDVEFCLGGLEERFSSLTRVVEERFSKIGLGGLVALEEVCVVEALA